MEYAGGGIISRSTDFVEGMTTKTNVVVLDCPAIVAFGSRLLSLFPKAWSSLTYRKQHMNWRQRCDAGRVVLS